MATEDRPSPTPVPPERELTLAPEGEQLVSVALLDAGVRSLAAQVEVLRQRTAGQPAAFFTRWAQWQAQWVSFAQRQIAPPMSAEDRVLLRHYAEQLEAIRQGVVRALTLPSVRSPEHRGGWPWWAWALLLGGGAALAWNVSKGRSE